MDNKPRLDGIRGVAILMVLIEHFAPYLGRPISAGFYGVNLFFVLSGFLITSTLIDQPNNAFGKTLLNFLARRSLRIFPIYYLLILLLFLLQAPAINDRLPYLLTYTYNYQLAILDFPEDPFRPLWSLAVEEQFYILFPLIAINFKKKLFHLLIICVLIVLIASLQLTTNIFALQKFNYVGLLTNMAPLSFGAIGAILYKKKVLVTETRLFEALLFLGIIIASIAFELKYQIILWGVLNLLLILKATQNCLRFSVFNDLLVNERMIWLGKISYGIYLYHGVVAFYIATYIFDPFWLSIDFARWGGWKKIEFHPWLLKFPLYSLLSIGVASYSYKYIEAPILKIKKYLA